MSNTNRLFVPLDVNFPDDDKIEAAGLAGAGLFAMALCVVKRTLSDGRITRIKLRRLGGDDALIDRCIEVGLFTADADDAVRIPAWLGWNKPAESVLTSEKAKQLAHVRHHVNKQVVNPQCRYCIGEEPQVTADGCADDAGRTGTQCADALPETESETTPTKSQDYTDSNPAEPQHGGGSAAAPDQQATPQAADLEQQTRRTAQLIGRDQGQGQGENPTAYAAGITKRILAAPEQRQRITDALAAGQTPEQIRDTWTDHDPADPLGLGERAPHPSAGADARGHYQRAQERTAAQLAGQTRADPAQTADARRQARAALRGDQDRPTRPTLVPPLEIS